MIDDLDDEPEDDDDLLRLAKETFELCIEVEDHNRVEAVNDIRFARLGQQWPETVRRERELEGRPCLVINKLPAMIRQVVNDARQNRPQIKVHPSDGVGDRETAEIMAGIVRNIEYVSRADVAYDTALDNAVSGGFGYIKVNLAYADDDSFDKDVLIEAVPNPFAIYGDPYSTAADGSDWMVAFETELVPRKQFKKRFPKAEISNWERSPYGELSAPWREDDSIRVCRWWRRKEEPRTVFMLSSGETVDAEEFEENPAAFEGLEVVGEREVPSFKVTHTLLSGAEVLEEEEEWAGRFIPIVPVYGEEVNLEGKRYFRSMVRDARDPQRMFNYWRTTTTELVALAPRTPFVGRKGTFDGDIEKWSTINTTNHAFVEFEGPEPPIRQPYAGAPAGAIQEAINAADDLKAITGLYDPSQGKASTADQSGKAILALQRQGDVGSFHFVDNMSRSIRYLGRILLDLIPKVYNTDRIVRVMGVDGEPKTVQTGTAPLPTASPMGPPPGAPMLPQGAPGMPPAAPQGPPPMIDPATGQPMNLAKIYDLSLGKYDCIVEAGPSFTSRREEAANQMLELIRALPQAAGVIGPMLAKNLDWPDAEEIADGLRQAAAQANQPKQSGPNPQQVMAELQAKSQTDMARIQAESQAKQQAAQSDAQLEMQKLQMQMKLQEQKLQMEIALKREQMMGELQIEREGMMLSAQIKSAEAANHLDQTVELPTHTIGGDVG